VRGCLSNRRQPASREALSMVIVHASERSNTTSQESSHGREEDRGLWALPGTDAAGRAVETLIQAGFSNNSISVLLQDDQSTKDFAHEKHTKPLRARHRCDGRRRRRRHAGTAGGIGALAIPGLGPFIAAGPSWAHSRVSVSVSASRLIGALVGMGIPEFESQTVRRPPEGWRRAVVRPLRHGGQITRAKGILTGTGAADIASVGETAVSTTDTPRSPAQHDGCLVQSIHWRLVTSRAEPPTAAPLIYASPRRHHGHSTFGSTSDSIKDTLHSIGDAAMRVSGRARTKPRNWERRHHHRQSAVGAIDAHARRSRTVLTTRHRRCSPRCSLRKTRPRTPQQQVARHAGRLQGALKAYPTAALIGAVVVGFAAAACCGAAEGWRAAEGRTRRAAARSLTPLAIGERVISPVGTSYR